MEQLRLKDYNLKQVEVRLRLIDADPLSSATPCRSPEAAVDVLRRYLGEMDREYLCVLNLDAATHPLNFHIVSIGTVNSALVSSRDIFKTAILSNAQSIIMMHNHPSGDVTPSKLDIQATKTVSRAAAILGVDMMDHIIVGINTYYSFRRQRPELFGEEPGLHAAESRVSEPGIRM